MYRLKTIISGLAISGIAVIGMTGQVLATEFYRMSTLEPGSSAYMIMTTFSQMVNNDDDLDVEIQVNATGSATRHAMEAANGQLDFFMWSATVHDSMMRGANMYQAVPDAHSLSENIRAVFAFPIGYYHILTDANSGVTGLEDLEGKKVFLGPPGGGATVVATRFVEAITGLVAGEDYEVVSVGWGSAAQAYQDGRIDVYINPTLPPSPSVEQFALSREIRLLGLDEGDLDKPAVDRLVNRPGGLVGTIGSDVYGENQANESDILTVGAMGGIATGKHVSEDEVYAITKSFWEQVENARESTPWLRHVQLSTAIDHLNAPLHPGAEKYYREIGMSIPEDLIAD